MSPPQTRQDRRPNWRAKPRTHKIVVEEFCQIGRLETIPNPFQIDSDKHLHIPKTKTPNTLNKIDISKHHNFHIKQLENSSNCW